MHIQTSKCKLFGTFFCVFNKPELFGSGSRQKSLLWAAPAPAKKALLWAAPAPAKIALLWAAPAPAKKALLWAALKLWIIYPIKLL